MVLKFSHATLVAVVACVAARAAQAQPGARGFGRGGGIEADRPMPAARGGPRQLMFGFALECFECTRSGRGGLPAAVWHYTQYPRVVAVARGGAAERAGVREGDVIMSIDGLSILTDDGTRRFSGVSPGEEIGITVERNNRSIELRLQLRRGPGQPPAPALPEAERPRYAGRVGGAGVEVWGDDPVIASTDSTGALVLRIGTTMVRVSPADFKAPKAAIKNNKPGFKPE